jgi:hypothetical protein
MTNHLACPLALAVLLGWGVESVHAEFVFNFDEFGNGSISIDGGPFMPNPGFVGLDPSTKMTTLIYALPAFVVPGEVLVKDADGYFGDAINFFDVGPNGFLAFYSEVGGGAPADVGVPILSNALVIEGADGHFDYLFYHGVSNDAAAPEPASLTMLGLGAIALTGYAWRRRQFMRLL